MIHRACDICSEPYMQRSDSDIAGRNGNWMKVYLCPKHKGFTRKNSENV